MIKNAVLLDVMTCSKADRY